MLTAKRGGIISRYKTAFKNHWQLYVIFSLPFALIFIFHYIPIYGIQIAFRKWNPILGSTDSQWVGLKYFESFFNSPDAVKLIWNTMRISLIDSAFGFPLPILLALAVNVCLSTKYKKVVQMVTYAPHFISVVVMVSILQQITDLRIGVVNNFIKLFGGSAYDFMGSVSAFPWIYMISGIWHSAGYSAIVYIAALAGVSPELHEAAVMDGASRFKRLLHIDIPCILPTVVIMLIMHIGNMFNVGYTKVYLMQNDLNLSVSEIISTYVYKVGLKNSNYSFSTAISLMNTVVSLVLVTSTNAIAKHLSGTSLW